MKIKMKILSLFDGMSCGQLALKKAGIKYDKYFASEIDKYASKVATDNFPNTINLGNVKSISGVNLPEIDLLLAGSPCQGFSSAGKKLGFEDDRSKLFFEFLRILKEVKPTYFLLENVKMNKFCQDKISQELGVEPVNINSSLFSAQNRNRLYWSNIPNINRPIRDSNIGWGDIRQFNVESNFYYSQKGLAWIAQREKKTGKKLSIWGDNDKCQMIEASHWKSYSNQRFFGIKDKNGLRYITPVECERAQTVPDNYTNSVSNSQRYKMLGNGWTIALVAHLLKGIKKEI